MIPSNSRQNEPKFRKKVIDLSQSDNSSNLYTGTHTHLHTKGEEKQIELTKSTPLTKMESYTESPTNRLNPLLIGIRI